MDIMMATSMAMSLYARKTPTMAYIAARTETTHSSIRMHGRGASILALSLRESMANCIANGQLKVHRPLFVYQRVTMEDPLQGLMLASSYHACRLPTARAPASLMPTNASILACTGPARAVNIYVSECCPILPDPGPRNIGEGCTRPHRIPPRPAAPGRPNTNRPMLVYGTANPVPYGTEDYNGLFLTSSDMDGMIPNMSGIPVKLEHKGVDIGRVVSAWRHEGRMDILLEIERNQIEGCLAKEFVQGGLCRDLSLGYKVSMSASSNGQLQASKKKVVEVSIVKQGAREDCHIRGWCSDHRIVL